MNTTCHAVATSKTRISPMMNLLYPAKRWFQNYTQACEDGQQRRIGVRSDGTV